MSKTVAVFDFDETLVLENSLGYLFQSVAGKCYWTSAIPAITKSIFACDYGYKLRLNVKKKLYETYLKGVSEDSVYQAGIAASSKLTVNANAMNELELASERGEIVIIATASPRIYVTAILDELNVNRFKVIGTEVDFESGHILGKECSREEKWNAVTKELQSLNVDKITAYGNAPDDLFMLEQVDQGFIVKGQSVTPYKN
ncbi:MAG: HAD superfamily phosphoserine phosphatase-like hydrolase [Cellvibrionaceae bacterium]|jgi:HAD superfamily phosphoserine phosphatase-like hydrolase